jgi:PAS domain S-box-containing protein
MTNTNQLKILFVEDLPSDVDLAVLELRKGNLKFEYTTVCTRIDLVKALNDFRPDLIISDFMMPAFTGLQALKAARDFDPEIPFILCTGSVNEEIAVECMKAGADDYVIKEHMTRLPFAVKDTLEQLIIKKEKRASDLLLKESEEKLQSIFSAAPIGIGLVVNRVLIEINDAFCSITGYERIELIGKSSEMLSPSREELKFVGKEYSRHLVENGKGSAETKIKSKEGKILNVLVSASPLDNNDPSKGIIITILDTTTKTLAETALTESEERFRKLYNDAIVGLYRTNVQGDILLANDSLVKMLGFKSFEELAARNLKEAGYGPTYQRKVFIDQIENTGEAKDMEAVWLSLDGREIIVRESAKAVYDSDGKILYYDGTVEDITQRKKMEEALLESQQLFKTLALMSPVGIFMTDTQGNTTYVNPKWSQLSGLSAEEAHGKGWLKAVHPDDKGKLSENWLSDFKSQNESSAEYRFIKPDNSIIWVMGKAVPELIGNELAGYIGTITDITERKKAEEELLESETKYRQLITHSPDGIFIVDLSGKFLSANKTICESLNYTEEELLSMNIWDIVPEKFHSVHKQRLVSIMNGESTKVSIEYDVIGKNGIRYSVEVLSVPFYKGNKLVGFQGIAHDISERKKKDKVLRESESSLRNAQEIAKMGSWEWDMVTQKDKWSNNFYAILGYSLSGVEPGFELFRSRIHPDDVYLLDEIHAKILMDRLPVNNELRLIQADGTIKWIQNNVIPVIEDDRLVKLKGATIDITERKLMEKILQEREEKYRLIFENVQDLYYETSMAGTILEVSPSIELLSKGQYRREDLIGNSMYDFFSDPKEREALLNILRERGFVSDFEITLRNRNGVSIPCSISSKLILDANGNPEKIIGSMRDITDRKNTSDALLFAKEKAEASDNLKTEFLNNISHEVRTPLNGILGFAEIISQTDLSEEDKRESISMLHESSDRLLNTITNYVDISLLTSGNMSVHKKDFIPGMILNKIYNNYKSICSIRNLELVLKNLDHTGDFSINSDPEIIHKIISHLLNNAIKFTKKGSITFGYNLHEGEVEFFVKDTGLGIGAKSIDIIFDNFVKEDHGASVFTEGSGLGLSIAKGMAEVIGGKIRVESTVGVGSCFYFTVPVTKYSEISHSGTSGRERKKIKDRNLILVAEDDETNFFYLSTLLTRKTGVTVLHASNGREAIELLKANPGIILIFMDMKMPDIDGFEATRQIKLIRKDVPVIAITAYAMSGDEERVLAAGCDGYLSKPISKKKLMEKMEEFVKV